MARNSGGQVVREGCGCTSERGGNRWVAMCRTHRAEFEQIHEQARQDYERRRERRRTR